MHCCHVCSRSGYTDGYQKRHAIKGALTVYASHIEVAELLGVIFYYCQKCIDGYNNYRRFYNAWGWLIVCKLMSNIHNHFLSHLPRDIVYYIAEFVAYERMTKLDECTTCAMYNKHDRYHADFRKCPFFLDENHICDHCHLARGNQTMMWCPKCKKACCRKCMIMSDIPDPRRYGIRQLHFKAACCPCKIN